MKKTAALLLKNVPTISTSMLFSAINEKVSPLLFLGQSHKADKTFLPKFFKSGQ